MTQATRRQRAFGCPQSPPRRTWIMHAACACRLNGIPSMAIDNSGRLAASRGVPEVCRSRHEPTHQCPYVYFVHSCSSNLWPVLTSCRSTASRPELQTGARNVPEADEMGASIQLFRTVESVAHACASQEVFGANSLRTWLPRSAGLTAAQRQGRHCDTATEPSSSLHMYMFACRANTWSFIR